MLLTVFPLLFFSLSAQTVNEDVMAIKKSNDALKARLAEQNKILSKQVKTSDSLIALIQVTNTEVKKSLENQNGMNQSVVKLQQQAASSNLALKNISEAFAKRKLYAVLGALVSVLVVLLYTLYFKKKLFGMNESRKQMEEELKKKMEQQMESLNHLSEKVDKERVETKVQLEKHIFETREVFAKQLASIIEKEDKMNREFNEKIMDTNKAIEKKFAASKN